MSSVVRERDDGTQCWSHIRFDSGERVLISIAGKPTPSIKVLRLVFAGLIPVKTIWELTPAKAGGDDAFVDYFMKMFVRDQSEIRRPLEAIRDALLPCSSIEEVRKMLSERESRVSRCVWWHHKTKSMEIVGWILWTILLWSAVTSLYWFVKQTGGVQAGTVSTLVNQWILVAWSLYFPHFNKFHLLWLTPLFYVWGVPGMFAFAFIRGKWIILTVAVAINLFLLALLT